MDRRCDQCRRSSGVRKFLFTWKRQCNSPGNTVITDTTGAAERGSQKSQSLLCCLFQGSQSYQHPRYCSWINALLHALWMSASTDLEALWLLNENDPPAVPKPATTLPTPFLAARGAILSTSAPSDASSEQYSPVLQANTLDYANRTQIRASAGVRPWHPAACPPANSSSSIG